MDIKINELLKPQETVQPQQNNIQQGDDFRFMLTSSIAEKDLQQRLTTLMEDITMQGDILKKRKDIKDMRRYRSLVKEFMNEIVNRSHEFARENFLDRRGRHRVYGIVRLVNEKLDKLAEELLKEEKDTLTVLNAIGEIRGMLIDLLM